MSDITHKGVVERVDSTKIYVSIESASACGSCHARGVCGASEREDKLIVVEHPQTEPINVGDHVTLFISTKTGMKAVFFSYLIPVIICVLVLLSMSAMNYPEPIIALNSLGILLVYFVILYIFRRKIGKNFNVKIEK